MQFQVDLPWLTGSNCAALKTTRWLAQGNAMGFRIYQS